MEQGQIAEGNKLIAEFMEKRMTDSELEAAFDDALWHESELEYHSSWDWLMPVVEKILFNSGNGHAQLDAKIISALSSVQISNVWQAIIKFIKWYNNEQSKQKK